MTPVVIITGALILIGAAGIAAVVSRYRWDRDVKAVLDAVDRLAPRRPGGIPIDTIAAASHVRYVRTRAIVRKLAARGELTEVAGGYRKPETGARS